jgi:hypothetical protein
MAVPNLAAERADTYVFLIVLVREVEGGGIGAVA